MIHTQASPAPGSALFTGILGEHNTLIAGTVGSGKTVLENGVIYTLLKHYDPLSAQIAIIDPKQFELRHWSRVAHCRAYADTPEGALRVLDAVEGVREFRSDYMKKRNLRKWNGSQVYLFIDELADLMTGQPKFSREFTEKLVKIMQLGRALNIHVIALTQQPRREVTPARLQVNFTCNVALHCRSAIESRQIIGEAGAENLPVYGKCIVSAAGYNKIYNVPMISDSEIDKAVAFWATKRK